MDPGEECDDGNDDQTDFCRSCLEYRPPRTVVKWVFNVDEALGYSGDGCIDTQTSKVQVELVGPVTQTLTESCSGRQAVFMELPAGTYTAKLTPLNSNDEALVAAPVEATIEVTVGDLEQEVNVPATAWTTAYTGTFFFRLTWGGQPCGTATPAVISQTLKLTVGGVVVDAHTDTNQKLDGTGPRPCRPSTDEFPQSALAVPFGAATFEVIGQDVGDAEVFHHTFQTFVGAGVSNPTLAYDLPAPPP